MSRERLLSLKDENDSKGFEMLTEAGRFKALAERNENGLAPKAISSFNLFQTPSHLADKMLNLTSFNGDYPNILEPSAGLGRLYTAINKKYPQSRCTVIENNRECAKELYNMVKDGTNIVQRDFLSVNILTIADLIIMNPPFKMGTDIKHIQHARKFLKKDGLLVALCYDGVKQNKILKPIADTWEQLPPDTFKSEGTKASVCLLTIKGDNLK